MPIHHYARPPTNMIFEKVLPLFISIAVWNVLILTAGTYSPFGANSQISNQTSRSCLECRWHGGAAAGGGAPRGDLTGWEIGIDGGSILLGGVRAEHKASCFAS